jgi:predicted MPP superfamily phosphohydrolase
VLGEGLFYLVALGALALACSMVGRRSGFLMFRLLAQGLFGELLLLAFWLAAEHCRRGWRARAVLPALIGMGLLAIYVEAYHRCPRALEVRTHRVGGTGDGRTLRILHLSDIQTPRIGEYERQVIRQATALRPDLVIFTGDYIQERYASTYEAGAAALNRLLRDEGPRAPLGFYALQGDVEWRPDWPSLFAGTGVLCLNNAHARVALSGGGTLVLTGLDSRSSKHGAGEAVRRIIDRAPPGDVRIVAGHSPDFIQHLAGRPRIDLALAGHTHGGQVVLPLFGPPITLSRLPRRYAGGLHAYGDIPLHVSRGIGMERGPAPQIRFLCPPEICVIELAVGE